MKTITLEFELEQGNYRLITNGPMLNDFNFYEIIGNKFDNSELLKKE